MGNIGWLVAGLLAWQLYKPKQPTVFTPKVSPVSPGTEGGTIAGTRRNMGYGINPIVQDAYNYNQDHFQLLNA